MKPNEIKIRTVGKLLFTSMGPSSLIYVEDLDLEGRPYWRYLTRYQEHDHQPGLDWSRVVAEFLAVLPAVESR